MEKVAVLIPCYNEELTIEKVVKDFKRELPDAEIYVYNNNSKDKSVEILDKIKGINVVNEYKQGKGNVVRSQFRDIDADIYVMVDADDTYPAEAVHDLIKEVREGRADMCIGDRLSNGTYKQENKNHSSIYPPGKVCKHHKWLPLSTSPTFSTFLFFISGPFS